jgi:hypothetical protein
VLPWDPEPGTAKAAPAESGCHMHFVLTP